MKRPRTYGGIDEEEARHIDKIQRIEQEDEGNKKLNYE